MRAFPLFLKFAGKKVLVVGGTTHLKSKIQDLLDAGAEVTQVARTLHSDLSHPRLKRIRRDVNATDLDGVWYIVSDAGKACNAQVSQWAQKKQIFVNAVDDMNAADAYLGARIRRGALTIAISTDGTAPALASVLREWVESTLPKNLDAWIDVAVELKKSWKTSPSKFGTRKAQLIQSIQNLQQGQNLDPFQLSHQDVA